MDFETWKISQAAGEKEATEFVEEREEESDFKKEKLNLLDLLFYFERADVGLPRSELLLLNLSIQKLISVKPIENVR